VDEESGEELHDADFLDRRAAAFFVKAVVT
jgi:hypothetical protein